MYRPSKDTFDVIHLWVSIECIFEWYTVTHINICHISCHSYLAWWSLSRHSYLSSWSLIHPQQLIRMCYTHHDEYKTCLRHAYDVTHDTASASWQLSHMTTVTHVLYSSWQLSHSCHDEYCHTVDTHMYILKTCVCQLCDSTHRDNCVTVVSYKTCVSYKTSYTQDMCVL